MAQKYPYLTRCIENTADLPAELHRKFKTLKDMDERMHKNMKQAEEAARITLKMGRHDGATPSKRQKLAETDVVMDEETAYLIKQVLDLSDEKLEVSKELYDYVDKQIQHLDADIKQYQAELKKERLRIGIPEGQTANQLLQAKDAAARTSKSNTKHKTGRRKKEVVAEPVVPVQQVIVPNTDAEPRYCICNGISYGEMVACDYEGCEKEWFHFTCVGVKKQPEGDWYCPNCIEEARRLGLVEDVEDQE